MMMSKKIFWAILKRIGGGIAVISILILLLFFIRYINHLRYSSKSIDTDFQLNDMDSYSIKQEGLRVSIIKEGALNGFHILPEEKKGKGVIVTFGGSEGGCNYETALELGRWEYEVVALFYFGQNNQPADLNLVPIDFFEDFIHYAGKQGISLEPLTLMGGSKGAELALVLAERFKEVDHLILYAPSSHVFQGMDFQNAASSWTYKGEELPFIAYESASASSSLSMLGALAFAYPMTLRPVYESAMERSPKAAEAKLKLEDFEGSILLFAGGEDALWPSDKMAMEIAKEHEKQTEVYIYENAGHTFDLAGNVLSEAGNIELGGSIEENRKAKKDSEEKLKIFLSKYHEN